MRAGGGQTDRRFAPDAARCSCDERNLSVQIEIVGHCSRVYRMEVTLYTRRDCPLCEDAKHAIRAAGLMPNEVDIDRDPDLKRRFTDDVPVIYIDGKEAFRHRVTAEQLTPFVLAGEKCVPCRGGVPPLKGQDLFALHRDLGGGWQVVQELHLEKDSRSRTFAEALAFTNTIGENAEE